MKELNLGSGVILRSAGISDLPGLFKVCLETGDSGKDATHLHQLPDLLGEIYVAPYVIYQPEFSYALTAADKIVGYLLAALDTKSFEEPLVKEYWPKIKSKYTKPDQSISEKDRDLLLELQKQGFSSEDLTTKYPSHLHIDIIADYQGSGYGKSMISFLLNQLKDSGSKGVHLHMAASNDRARYFYKSFGFAEISEDANECIMGLRF